MITMEEVPEEKGSLLEVKQDLLHRRIFPAPLIVAIQEIFLSTFKMLQHCQLMIQPQGPDRNIDGVIQVM
jgi:hypothetical protein